MLRNRKEQEQPKLVGVNHIADPTKLALGTFQTLQNWIPAKRYKIKKKRGVEALVDSPAAPVVPTNCAPCVDTALVLPQQIEQVAVFNNDQIQTDNPAGGAAVRVSWGYIGVSDEIWVLQQGSTKNNWIRFHDGTYDVVQLAGGTPGGPNFRVGRSDEPSFFGTSGGDGTYARIDDITTGAFTSHTLTGFTTDAKHWVKSGSLILVENFNGSSDDNIREYSLSTDTLTQSAAGTGNGNGVISALDVSGSYYYVLHSIDGGDGSVLTRLNKAGLTVHDSFSFSSAGYAPAGIFVVDDTLVYWWNFSVVAGLQIGYLANFSSLVVVDDAIAYTPGTINPSLAGTRQAWFRDGFFYVGDDGADGTMNIYKFGPFLC